MGSEMCIRDRGWQRQGNTANTIQARVEDALERAAGERAEIAASGRTDAGVHAKCQVCSFKTAKELDCEKTLAALREHLPEDIGALSLERAGERFHARLSCRGKTYVYRVWNSAAPNVFERRYMYRYSAPLDIERMRRAAAYLLGEQDFASFCGNPRMKKSTVRMVDHIGIEQRRDRVIFTFHGTGFLQNMVRILVGTLLEVGRGYWEPEYVQEILLAKDRKRAGPTAPPEGLCLMKVDY